MPGTEQEDSTLAGKVGPGDGESQFHIWVGPVVSAVIIVIGTLVNGWIAFAANTSADLAEQRHEALTDQLNEIRNRQDRLDDRIIYLEQRQMTGLGDESPRLTHAAYSSNPYSRLDGIERCHY